MGCALTPSLAGMLLLCALSYACTRAALRRTALLTFLLGTVHGALATAYRPDVVRVQSTRVVSFREQRGDPLNAFRPRAMQITELRVIASGARLTVIHVHVNAMGAPKWRAAQVAEATAGATDAARSGADVVLCGDLNAPEREVAAMRLEVAGLTDAYVARTQDGSGATWDARNPLTAGFVRDADARCDYVFVSLRRARLASCQTVMDTPPYTSDHFGVRVELTTTST